MDGAAEKGGAGAAIGAWKDREDAGLEEHYHFQDRTSSKGKNAAKTIQSARSQTSAALLTSDGGERAMTGLLSK